MAVSSVDSVHFSVFSFPQNHGSCFPQITQILRRIAAEFSIDLFAVSLGLKHFHSQVGARSACVNLRDLREMTYQNGNIQRRQDPKYNDCPNRKCSLRVLTSSRLFQALSGYSMRSGVCQTNEIIRKAQNQETQNPSCQERDFV